MKCAICQNGKTEKGNTTVVLERDQTTLVYKNVPANIYYNVERSISQLQSENYRRKRSMSTLLFDIC